jgi:hypothetical protein
MKLKFATLTLVGGLSVPVFATPDEPSSEPSQVNDEVAAFEDALSPDDQVNTPDTEEGRRRIGQQTQGTRQIGQQTRQQRIRQFGQRGKRRAALRLLRLRRAKRICAKVNLTDDQKASLKTELMSYKEKALPLEAAIKVAKIRYIRNALAVDGTASFAGTSATEGITAATSLMQAKEDLTTNVLFNILQQDQRKAGLRCMYAVRRVAKRHQRSLFR